MTSKRLKQLLLALNGLELAGMRNAHEELATGTFDEIAAQNRRLAIVGLVEKIERTAERRGRVSSRVERGEK